MFLKLFFSHASCIVKKDKTAIPLPYDIQHLFDVTLININNFSVHSLDFDLTKNHLYCKYTAIF